MCRSCTRTLKNEGSKKKKHLLNIKLVKWETIVYKVTENSNIELVFSLFLSFQVLQIFHRNPNSQKYNSIVLFVLVVSLSFFFWMGHVCDIHTSLYSNLVRMWHSNGKGKNVQQQKTFTLLTGDSSNQPTTMKQNFLTVKIVNIKRK